MKIDSIKYKVTDVGHKDDLFLEQIGENKWVVTNGKSCMSKHFYFDNCEEYSQTRFNFDVKVFKNHKLSEFIFTKNEAITYLEAFEKLNKGNLNKVEL